MAIMKEWTDKDFYQALKKKNKGAFYLYTPMCGTCQLASKMLDVVEKLFQNLEIGKANLNYFPQLAIEYQIESVPCLLIFENGNVIDKIYAFHSVTYLYEKLK